MSDLKSDTAKILDNILVGLFMIIVFVLFLGATFGLGFYTAHTNGQKVQQMTEYCVSQGYDGWVSTNGRGEDTVSCYND